MTDVIDFNSAKTKRSTEKAEKAAKLPLFYDGCDVGDHISKVIDDESMMLAFTTMLLMMRNISTDGEMSIEITNNGIHFNSMNSVKTDDPFNGMQSNMSVNKQAYMLLNDYDGNTIDPKELASTLRSVVSSLIMYNDVYVDDLVDDENNDS